MSLGFLPGWRCGRQFGGILPILLIMVIFYVLLILPAQKRQKKTAAMLSRLKNGDKVITTGGVFGTIVGLEDDAVQLRIADQVKVKVLRSRLRGLQPENKESLSAGQETPAAQRPWTKLNDEFQPEVESNFCRSSGSAVLYGLFGLPDFPTSISEIETEFFAAHQAGA